jgi:hypothetical protein
MDILASLVGHFIPAETASDTLRIKEEVSPRYCLDALEKSKALCSFQDSNHDYSVVSPQHRYCTHDWVVVKNMSELLL